MIKAEQFVQQARQLGFDYFAGVPCSFLTPFINYVIEASGLTYVSSANEGDAVAAAAGAYIGGRRGVAMMQNSGLGNAVSPLSSLAYTFRIPVLLIITHRGAPTLKDEPQHELMGRITGDLLDTLEIPWTWFPADEQEIAPSLQRADQQMQASQRPFAFLMRKDSVAAGPKLNANSSPVHRTNFPEPIPLWAGNGERRPARGDFLQRIIEHTPLGRSVVLATTGYTGRELSALQDRSNQLYMIGSMGCASSLGLGLAMVRPDLEVTVIDGDGAALMRMGNIATVGSYAGTNLVHILLDNEAYDSTGAQASVSANVSFARIAAACGYRRVIEGDTLEVIDELYDKDATGPAFAHIKIRTVTMDKPPRPTLSSVEVKSRLMSAIGAQTAGRC